MKQVLAKVVKIKQLLKELERSPRPGARNILGGWLIWLDCPEIAGEALPGQFVMVGCGQECVLPRPFSVHQVDGKGNLALFFAVLADGRGTNWLAERQPGDTVELFGPLGNGFTISPTSRNLLLVGGGMGIAPLVFLARQASTRGLSATLLYGTANQNQYPPDLLPSGIKLVRATEDGSAGQRGRVTDLLPDYIDWADQVFACGSLPMYRSMAESPQLKGKSVQVSLEVRMGCGVGVCYGCTIKTKNGLKQACQDGPVFDLRDILWEEVVC